MNKKDSVKFLSAVTGLTHKQAEAFIGNLPELLLKSLEDSGRLAIPDFGVFVLKNRKSRTGRNLWTGEKIDIPEKKVVKFKPSPIFLNKLQKDSE